MIYFFDGKIELNRSPSELLPPERYEKFQRLRRESDRQNCLGAYLLLKFALKEEYGIEHFTVDEGQNGKPYLTQFDEIRFNISHCDEGIAVAVSSGEVGIDIQGITEAKDGVMNRVFLESERKFVMTAADRNSEFTRIWSLKESAVKRRGETLADIKNYEFAVSGDRFKKYGDSYSVFRTEKAYICVCADEFYDKIITVTKDVL